MQTGPRKERISHGVALNNNPICFYLQIGKFFGEVDGAVMSQLLRMGMFKRVTLYDYQAMCKSSHHHTSSARPLLSVCPAGLLPSLISDNWEDSEVMF
uniref:Voltage-dependent calcium channel alpha-2/delta subunit conserved region domain-containing protein n=1 Tax=Scleropages formosus TaxID=113540 RepID=A0A8C9T6U4_SCLFO